MASDSDDSTSASSSPPPDLPNNLAERLGTLRPRELRAVIRYARSLLSPAKTVTDLLEERPGEEIVEVNEYDGFTTVVKREPCAEGCEECPHEPVLYRVRVEPSPETGEPPLHWDFLGGVRE